MKHLLKRNKNCPNTEEDGLIDESVISETEGKMIIIIISEIESILWIK